MKNYQFLRLLCKNLKNGKFNDEKYRCGGTYYGREIHTMPLFCSYGLIGCTVTIDNDTDVTWDWDLRKLTIDEVNYKEAINQAYLEEYDISASIDDSDVELETYTDAGEDMIISLDHLTKEELQSYINGFDVNDNVMLWWRDGEDKAHEHGVPFTNIKDHYEDYEAYLATLQEVCNGMPF